ncbi:hypothetical protein Gotri_018707 [Gossypium trilobum]|uniref:DUF4283 domain-containing protein n=1 Tax=Gossypium trilobum TaxID=34281 RepID=A0A7J9EBX6_9ROSI|nr:hypothetical protein [Gossypium trilobum]
MEHELADLSLDDREEEGLGVPTEVGLQSMVSEFSIVGYFLTASIVHFSAMKSTMVNVWHLVKGVQISDLGDKHFLFKFFHRIDLERVINGAHWTFNNHLLVFHRLEMGEDSVKVPLLYGADPSGGKMDFVYESGINGRWDTGIKRDPMLGINLEWSGGNILRVDGCGD